jgi:2-methylcitrate dehydratase PrpD
VANALLRGNTGLQAFTDEKVNSENAQQFMKKISVRLNPEIKALDAKVELQTVDGRKFDAYSDIFKEIPELAAKQEKIKAKFTDLCEPVAGKDKTSELVRMIATLEKTQNLEPFFSLLL